MLGGWPASCRVLRAMDRVKPPSPARNVRRFAWIGGTILLLVGVGTAIARVDFSTARVDRTKITIATVEQGTLEILVRGSGQLLPRNVEYLGAQVSGRVAKKLIKPGDAVKAGQVILELTNPQVVASAEEASSAWEGSVIDLRASESELKTDLLNHEITLTQARFNLGSAQLQLKAETELKEAKLVPGVVYERTRLNVTQLQQTLDLEENRVDAIRANIQMQVAAKQAHVTELARALERARTAAGNLKIVAGIDGIVQSLTADIGQELAAGQSIGRIAQPDPLYAELKVPAREAADLRTGQSVVVDTHNGTVDGVVSRVDPGITEGSVVVDVTFQGKMPPGARPQLAVDGDVYLDRLPNAIYVGKPSFAQADGDVSVYRLDDSGRYADRVVIRSGKLSLTQMQVLKGLKPGDRIISSQAGDWQNKDRIRID